MSEFTAAYNSQTGLVLKLPDWSVHCLLISVPVIVSYMYFNGELFGWHATCMSLGYVLLMGNGVWMSSRATVKPNGEERLMLLKLHGLFQAGAALSVAIGLYCIYHNKEIHGKPHFTTYHSQAGLVVLIATSAAVVMGVLGFKYLGLIRFVPENMHGLLKTVHRRTGAVTFFSSVFVAMLGLSTASIHQGMLTYFVLGLTSLAGGAVFNIYYARPQVGGVFNVVPLLSSIE
uniref:Cytochrome b561 domain-containing protein n=1 Tax=Pyramimonas obovata TaxID=1411642 RepID=A0A7S0WG64_9CHLO|mmetsp:Transcript_2479/g.5121  ORF Transcript_2479/g.5121 Transcript_2479/m.5121 type:complete len:231 (+) Transcript_2479:124-816(+)|eukprot:CAMPEP_0118932678 /NCGR_PEP_ID=MMETSP1169-20130426/10563_1 /TAXON_ID=36882 /ORGANISM="Pyramimonas obovata, Strain CCMP722" /LENGTH=230 /DNA_ID=CAMNT_0006875373 /DNA_START=124 /DNA_END=816 /DNA_ORIENTATION=+